MKHSKLARSILFTSTIALAGSANAAIVFDLDVASSIFGQDTISVTSGDYTLDITATSGGAAAKLAQQTGSGLGVKLPSDASSTWFIGFDETVTFTITDSSGAVQFSDLKLKFDYSSHFFGNERADVSLDSGTAFEVQGGARGSNADDSDAPFIDIASGSALSASITPTTKTVSEVTTNTADFRILAVSVEVAPVPVPAAAWLFGSAVFGLGCVRRKRAQS